MSDLTRGMEPGSDEWFQAMAKGAAARESLEASHLAGDEIIVRMMPDGTLVRGEHLDDLQWW